MTIDTCPIHGDTKWIESTPPGWGYCQQCAQDDPRNQQLGDTTGDRTSGCGS